MPSLTASQDVVGRGDVEIEIRQAEAEEVGLALEAKLAVAQREGDVTRLGAGEVLGRQAFDERDRLGDPLFQLGEARLVVGIFGNVGAGEARRSSLGEV